MASTLTRDQVRDAYNALLGRNPESEGAIQSAIDNYSDLPTLYRSIAFSEEFKGRSEEAQTERDQLMRTVTNAFWAPRRQIDHEVSQEIMTRLVERIRDQWTRLGEVDPHWSVLTHDSFRAENLTDAQMAVFNKSGEGDARTVQHFENRTGRKAKHGVCLELGCGVGRITRYLANDFESVIAVDISPGNLRLCDAYLKSEGVTNVETVRISGIEDFDQLPQIDFFFSLIVLQHNSPPIQKAVLRTILSKIRPGGGAVFQIPTDVADYSFDVASYLDTESPEMEVHCLPKSIVLQEIQNAGLEIVDMLPDAAIGDLGSHTFYALKPV